MTQLTIIDQVKEVEAKSGVPLEIDITEVVKLAERGKAITSVDDENFAAVKKEMQQTRKYVTEYFEDARSEFNRMAKGIISVQKMVLNEFTPEEERLIALDKAEKERKLKEERLEALPAKRERITTAGIEFPDEEVLELSDADFEIEYNRRLGEKLEADRIAAEEKRKEEEAKLEAERAEIQRQKDEAARIEAAREEERKRAEEALKFEKEKAEREAKEAEERRKAEMKEKIDAQNNTRIEKLVSLGLAYSPRENSYLLDDINVALVDLQTKDSEEWATLVGKIEAEIKRRKEAEEARVVEEAAAKAEADRLANEKYQAFLKENNYNEDTDIIRVAEDGTTRIYRLVAEFKSE